MIGIKQIKKDGKKHIRKNYWSLVFICLMMAVLFNGYKITMQSYETFQNYSVLTSNEENNDEDDYSLWINSAFSTTSNDLNNNIRDDSILVKCIYQVVDAIVTDNEQLCNFIYSITKNSDKEISIETILIISAILAIIIKIFIVYSIEVGECRLFLENRNGKETRIKVMLSAFKKGRYLSTVKCIFVKRVFQYLWTLTIIGGIISRYSYMMVPYIVAENPDIKPMEAIRLSKNMMKGYKFKAFLFDLSFIGWSILQIITFGLVGILYANPYYKASETEIYIKIREEYILANKEKAEWFAEENLINLDIDNEYVKKIEDKLLEGKKYDRKYSITIIIMFFFTFAFLGWLWEVLLFLFRDGILVNRGTLYGPYLPIYGFGAVLVVLMTRINVFKKVLSNPMAAFIIIMILCTSIEYVTSWYIETFYGLRYWDYTNDFLNINGRVCLECSLFFGFGGILGVYLLAPFLDEHYLKIKKSIRVVLCIIIIGIISADFVFTKFYPRTGPGITTNVESESINLKTNFVL